MRIMNNEVIKLEAPDFDSGKASYIMLSESGHFVIAAGENGFAVKSTSGKNLLFVDNNGNVHIDEGNVILKSPNGT